ncbi:MAG: hypothetical protein DI533_06735 [Cereibacter sphaeroides]|uniref:Alpha/beta hydrolase n=1 Tax=Cereibacter sphaeroides TaxID=1063 RepID=A0A2W5UA91_CERSP|nr:MAG: hypothetical protein DI533_06735 [Cereibacter sphaeroides]
MPLVQVTAEGPKASFDHEALRAALADLPCGAPVVVMIHGFRFAPGVGRHCPHTHILSLTPNRADPTAISWPRHLRLGGRNAGLALAFGWWARGTIWHAHREAAEAGLALASLVATVREIDPSRSVDILAHSLGARVVLSALPLVEAGAFGRIILMAAAEFRAQAEAAIDSPAGLRAEVVNITTRENDMFDLCIETLISAGAECCVGHGLSKPRANWLDLQIDRPETVSALAGLGFRLAPRRNRVCHWSPYMRPGVFHLYRAILNREISPALLRAHLPAGQEARWARLWPALPAFPRLPLPGNPA